MASMESEKVGGYGKKYERKKADHCSTGAGAGAGAVVADNASEGGIPKDHFEKSSSLLEATNVSSSKMQPQSTPETESESSEAIEDDVKVCDICGDAGLEDLLAFCSRCSDGAEHTYCMRKKLDQLPEGDWLCEECKLEEETRNKEVHKSGAISRAHEVQCSNEDNKEVDKSGAISRAPEVQSSNEDDKDVDKSGAISRAPEVQCLNEHDDEVDKSGAISRAPEVQCLNEHNDEVDKSGAISRVPEVQCSNEYSENMGKPSDPKIVPKLVTKPSVEEAREMSKEQGKLEVFDKMHAISVEVASVATKKVSEIDSRSTCIRKESGIADGNSFHNLDMGKVKTIMPGSPYENRPIHPLDKTEPSSSIPAAIQTSRGSLSKSASFKNSNMKPKVKQLTGILPPMQKRTKFTSGYTKGEGLVKEMTRSTSLKSASSGYSNAEQVSKMQSRPRLADPTREVKLVKERNTIDKRPLSTKDLPLVSPKPTDSIGLSLPKPDIRIASLTTQDILGTKKVSDDTPGSKGPSSSGICILENENPSKAVPNNTSHANSTTTNISSRNPETVHQRSAPQVVGSTHRDDKIKNPTCLSSSRQTVPGGGRVLRCQRCNETGHSTQNCSVDKLRVNALKLSGDRNLNDRTDKTNKWKDAVEASISKTTVQKTQKLTNQTEKLPMSRPDMNTEAAFSNSLSLSSHLLEGTRNGLGSLKSSVADSSTTVGAIAGKSQSVPRVGISFVPRASESNSSPIISDELTVKANSQLNQNHASASVCSFKASVIPELEFIWQGGLEVLRAGKLPEVCEGLQAHLSSSASPKVLEVAKKFRCKVEVDEVTRLSSWPLQFQGNLPNEDNIALFFFARDTDSYEKKYRILLENMLQNDLALKGNIDGVELLIFPSNTLPVHCQRWNRLLFLWGVFRRMRTNCTNTLPDSREKPCGSSFTVQPLLSFISADRSTSPIISSTNNHEGGLPMSDISKTSQHRGVSPTQLSSEKDVDKACLRNSKSDSEGAMDVASSTCSSILKQGSGAGASKSLTVPMIMRGEAALKEDNMDEDVTEIDYLSWESSHERKRAHSASNSSTSHVSGETVKSTGETKQCSSGKVNHGSIDGEKERKKMKLGVGGDAGTSSIYDETVACDDGSSAGRQFGPVCFLSSNDEDLPESNTPDLELALWGEKKPAKQGLLPLLPPNISIRSNQDKLPGPSENDRDDGSESLSLSLGFPAFE